MSELSITILDAATNEVTERAFTNEEIQAYDLIATEFAAAKKAEDDKAAARQSALAKLAALGLTEEEIAAL
jgi:DNA-binding NarL/FixJ family response regulator